MEDLHQIDHDNEPIVDDVMYIIKKFNFWGLHFHDLHETDKFANFYTSPKYVALQ